MYANDHIGGLPHLTHQPFRLAGDIVVRTENVLKFMFCLF
jgi:hypothetical protein